MQRSSKGLLFGVLAVFLWATSAASFKIALRYISSMELLAIATITALLILSSILLLQGRFSEITSQNRKVYLYAALLGLLNPFLYYLVLFKAYSLIPAQIAQPLNFIWPIVLVLLSVPILHQSITKFNVLGLLVSFAGVLVISMQGKLSFHSFGNPLGIFLAAGSSVIWALYWIFNVKQNIEEVLGLFLNFLFSSLYIVVLLLFTSEIHVPPIEGVLGGVYVGFFEMGVTFVFWLKALNFSGSAARVGNLIYLTPFLSLLCIHFVLGETIYITTFAGLLIIVLGLFINKRK